MDPNMLQALMQLLQGGSVPGNAGAIGPSGEFSTDPASQIAQMQQVGDPLQFQSGISPTGMNPGYNQTMQMFQGGMPGMQGGMPGMNPLQGGPSSMNSMNSGQNQNNMLPVSNAQSVMNYLKG